MNSHSLNRPGPEAPPPDQKPSPKETRPRLFVSWHPDHPTVPVYAFFGDSNNQPPRWALQAVGPADEGKKKGGKVIVDLLNIMRRINAAGCWSNPIKEEMAGASRSRSKDNGPAWSDVLREIYFSQPEIPTALTKSKKRKGDQAERDSNQKRNRQATKKPPMTAPPNRNDQHAPLTHTSPPLGLGHGLNRVSNMNTADAVQPQTHISHPFKLEDRLNRAGNIKKEETVQPQTGTESPPGLGSRRHHTLNLSTVEAVQPQTGTESPPRLDHRRYYIVNMTITEAVQPSTQTESPPGLGSRRHRTGNMSAVEPARAVSRRSLEDDRDLNEAGREDTHTFTSLLLPKDARISSFSPKSNADTEHQSVAKRPLFSYGQVRQAENVSEIVRSLKSTKTQQTETETPTMSSQAKRPIAAPVPSIRAGVAELSHTRDMPSQLMTPSPSKPVEKEAVPMKIPEFLKGWL